MSNRANQLSLPRDILRQRICSEWKFTAAKMIAIADGVLLCLSIGGCLGGPEMAATIAVPLFVIDGVGAVAWAAIFGATRNAYPDFDESLSTFGESGVDLIFLGEKKCDEPSNLERVWQQQTGLSKEDLDWCFHAHHQFPKKALQRIELKIEGSRLLMCGHYYEESTRTIQLATLCDSIG